MSADFQRALAFVLKVEGGYTNDPVDRGGATNRGGPGSGAKDAGF